MANALYNKAREGFAKAQINWETDTIKAVLVDSGAYTFSAAHQFISDVPSGARISSIQTLSGKTATDGACDANDLTFPSVSGASIEVIIIFKDTGTEATSPVLAYIDSGTGLPITPNSGDIIVTWDNGINKIFRV